MINHVHPPPVCTLEATLPLALSTYDGWLKEPVTEALSKRLISDLKL